jgi:hypothetical protein
MPRKPKSKAKPQTGTGRAVRRSREDVQSVLTEIEAKISEGSTIKSALEQAGVSYSNYNYWKRREGAHSARRGRGAGIIRGRSSVIALLNEMTENRRQADSARKNLAVLDARFESLKKQLERTSG